MNKMDFDSALRRQVMSLPELMRQQYADLEPKTRTVLSTPEIFNIQRIVLTGCGDSYAALLAVKPAFEKYAKIRTEVVPTATTRRSVCASVSMTLRSTDMYSVCISCPSSVSLFTGLNVPAPTCNVSSRRGIPRAERAASTSGVKCKPAVGAATDPSILEYTVW